MKVIVHSEWGKGRGDSKFVVNFKHKDGRIFTKELGEEPTQLTRGEILDRFRVLTKPFMDNHRIERVIELSMNLEKIERISELMDIVTFLR